MSAARVGRVLLGVWFAAPLAGLCLWAVADVWRADSVLPSQWGWRGWTAAVDAGAPAAIARSIALSVAVAALAMPAGAMAARALDHAGRRLRAFAVVVLITPVVVPPLTVVLGLDVLLLRLHVPMTVGVVTVLLVQALPYTTYIMYAAYQGYDPAYEDEARTLGASPWTLLTRVHIPLVAPGLAAATFLALLVGWSDYVVTVVVGGGQLVTLPVLVASNAAGTGNEPVVAALSLTAVIPPLATLLLIGLVGRRARDPVHTGRIAPYRRARPAPEVMS